MNIEIAQSRTVYEGWAKFSVATFRLGGGETIRREIEDHGRAAAVLPYDDVRKTAILIRQFRAPVFVAAREPGLLEAIAGIVEEADPEVTVRREAQEEAGLAIRSLQRIAEVWTMPGLSTERMSLYLATYGASDRTSAGGAAARERELIDVVELPLRELALLADSGRLADMKTLALVQSLRLRRPDLFEG